MRPKGSAEALEARRRRAATLLERGSGIREVARQIGSSPSSVKRWKEVIEKGEKEALMAKPHPAGLLACLPDRERNFWDYFWKGLWLMSMKINCGRCRG
jgi:hypothetical protein